MPPPKGADGPGPTKQLFTARERETAALTVWAECRGQPWEGQLAVAYVIRNRFEQPSWWGTGLAGVCLKPWQFSCWNKSVEHGSQLDRLNNPATKKLKSYADAMAAVDVALAGLEPDPTNGAAYYCTPAVVNQTKWARGKTPSAVIGGHVFFTKQEAERKIT